MPVILTCPKATCGRRGYRVYSQVYSRETDASTSVALPFVFCAEPDGKGGLKAIHGLQPVSPAALAAAKRSTNAKKAPPTARKAPAKPKAAPGAKKGGKGRSRASGKAPERSPDAPGSE